MREWIISSSVLIIIVIALRFALRGRIKLRVQYALWGLVLFRLLLPMNFGSSAVSVMNFVPAESAWKPALVDYAPAEREPYVQAKQDPAGQYMLFEPVSPAMPVEAGSGHSPSQPAAGVPATRAKPDLMQLAKLLWLCGAGLVILASVCSNAVYSGRLRRGRRAVKAEGCQLPVYSCAWLQTPCLDGLFRPAVYIMPELLDSPEELSHVLRHETAHFIHGDHVWARLRCLCLALHWYNPLVWLAAVLSKRDAELACDEAATAKMDNTERLGYGRTLIGLTCPGGAGILRAATTMTGSRRGLKERIKLLANRPRMAAITLVMVLIIAVTAAGCTFTGRNGGVEANVIAAEDEKGAEVSEQAEPLGAENGGENEPFSPFYTVLDRGKPGPRPDASNFGSTTEPDDILKLIDSASALLDGQSLSFDPEADFVPGSDIKYYFDDTILAIAWKEAIDGKCVTCAEVKIADGSQLRRTLAGGSLESEDNLTASQLAEEANAVIGINGDHYRFRTLGFTSYQGELFGAAPGALDSCFFNSEGDMFFTYAGTFTDLDTASRFIEENDVVFSLAFGPVLVADGEIRHTDSYPVGEIGRAYSRSAIGQIDKLHYMLMTINYEEGFEVTATIAQTAELMYDKGCRNAYAMDGGQNSELVMQGQPVNSIDYGSERPMSDIVYFATAVPEP